MPLGGEKKQDKEKMPARGPSEKNNVWGGTCQRILERPKPCCLGGAYLIEQPSYSSKGLFIRSTHAKNICSIFIYSPKGTTYDQRSVSSYGSALCVIVSHSFPACLPSSCYKLELYPYSLRPYYRRKR